MTVARMAMVCVAAMLEHELGVCHTTKDGESFGQICLVPSRVANIAFKLAARYDEDHP